MDEVAGVLFVRQPRHRWCEVVRPQYGPQPALVTVVTPLVWRREIYVENANMLSRGVHRCEKNTTHGVKSLDPNTVRNQRWSQLWKPYTTGVKTTNDKPKYENADMLPRAVVEKLPPQVWSFQTQRWKAEDICEKIHTTGVMASGTRTKT